MKISFNKRIDKYIKDAIILGVKTTLTLHNNTSDVSVTIISKDEIATLNSTFRGVSKPTDVLSFPMNEYGLLGDIALCDDIIKKQAIEYNNTVEYEYMYLSIHSALHLLGYDHIDEKDKKIMRNKEKDVLRIVANEKI